jgi:hypothetical protein
MGEMSVRGAVRAVNTGTNLLARGGGDRRVDIVSGADAVGTCTSTAMEDAIHGARYRNTSTVIDDTFHATAWMLSHSKR